MSVVFNMLITFGQLVFAFGCTLDVRVEVSSSLGARERSRAGRLALGCAAGLHLRLHVTVCRFCCHFGVQSVSDRWPVMWLGRIFFGFGGESLSVAQSAMIAKWFVGKELALGAWVPPIWLACIFSKCMCVCVMSLQSRRTGASGAVSQLSAPLYDLPAASWHAGVGQRSA